MCATKLLIFKARSLHIRKKNPSGTLSLSLCLSSKNEKESIWQWKTKPFGDFKIFFQSILKTFIYISFYCLYRETQIFGILLLQCKSLRQESSHRAELGWCQYMNSQTIGQLTGILPPHVTASIMGYKMVWERKSKLKLSPMAWQLFDI